MIQYWRARNGKWYFHRRARNGKTTDPSQGYSTMSNCKRAFRARFGSEVEFERTQ